MAYANQGCVAAGVLLYRMVWQGYTPDIWCGMSQRLAAGAAVEEASAMEDAELIDLEESERMSASLSEVIRQILYHSIAISHQTVVKTHVSKVESVSSL
eukprot:6183505-Pleurochrysis_carterae.AAC.1